MNFFKDSDGNWSYGRLASMILVIGSLVLAYFGKDYGVAVSTALAFYATSKTVQAVTSVRGDSNEQKP